MSPRRTAAFPNAAQAAVFAEPDGSVNLIAAFDTAAAMVENQAKVQAAFRTGRGSPGAMWRNVCILGDVTLRLPGRSVSARQRGRTHAADCRPEFITRHG
jgi:hypothetical protein